MKRPNCQRGCRRDRVAPFAGAWIETPPARGATSATPVAPFAGAWIETLPLEGLRRDGLVAPFAGAWIETHST